jgi:hypothetical protein
VLANHGENSRVTPMLEIVWTNTVRSTPLAASSGYKSSGPNRRIAASRLSSMDTRAAQDSRNGGGRRPRVMASGSSRRRPWLSGRARGQAGWRSRTSRGFIQLGRRATADHDGRHRARKLHSRCLQRDAMSLADGAYAPGTLEQWGGSRQIVVVRTWLWVGHDASVVDAAGMVVPRSRHSGSSSSSAPCSSSV